MAFLNEFNFPIRVYYEDTDAGGVVYHSNYLCFMERARTEWLRHLGFDHLHLARDFNIIFVVGHLDISYKRPARFNDELWVSTTIHTLGHASIVFEQKIWRKDQDNNPELLTSSHVKVVCVDLGTFRSTPIPILIRDALT